MKKTGETMHRRWMVVIKTVSLGLLWSIAVLSVARAEAPSAICILQLVGDGRVLGVLVDTPQNFNIAVLLPVDKYVNVPILCDSLGSLAIGMANQEAHATTISMEIFTHDGVSICAKGGFELPVNGARGVTFADCQ